MVRLYDVVRSPLFQGLVVGCVGVAVLFSVYLTGVFLHTGKAWQQITSGEVSVATFFFNRGNYYFGEGAYDIETALRNYLRALSFTNKENKPIHYQVGRIYFIKGQLNDAVAMFDRQLELDPEFMRSYYMRGLTYGYMGQYDKAEADFKEFLTWRPQSWAAHNDLVWVYFLAGRFDEAERYAREGLQYTPANAWLANSLGAILLNKKDYEEAQYYLTLAKDGFTAMTPEQWGGAYPGNDPRIYGQGLEATLKSVEENLVLVNAALEVNN